ncbi:MAG TPA: flagellar export protein FliJ [Saccharospirillum sp.]|nr:flagellar export protein FliJ [Saccharospirillum sp.]
MKRSQRMQLIEKLARQREDQAAQALAQTRQRLEQEQAQLNELEGYRGEYLSYLETQGSAGLSIVQWRRTQGFIDQLGGVIGQQEGVIRQWQRQEQQVLMQWQKLYQRRKSIGQLVDKLSLQEVIEADKQEQKALDELVGQMGQRSGPGR